jgi:hypothetical protein
MARYGLGPSVDRVTRIVASTMDTAEKRWDCLRCGWMLRIMPHAVAEGERRARLHAVSHEFETRGGIMIGGSHVAP